MRYLTTIVVAIVLALSFANGAPQMRRHRRHGSVENDVFRPSKVAWSNSCGSSTKNDTFGIHRSRTVKPLKGLRNELPNYINRLNEPRSQAISTDDVSRWFSQPFNSTYSFLAQINASISNIHLRKRHIETQVYVGAFQYLRWKQFRHDMIRNEDNNKTRALEYLLILAKNLLCEIETAINNTGMKMPMILTKEAMHKRLTFRNNNNTMKVITDKTNDIDEVDEIDNGFAKIRFGEYLNGLQTVLRNRMGKQHHHIGKKAKKNQMPPLKRKNKLNATIVAMVPKEIKPIDQVPNEHENDIDDSITPTKRHHNVDLKHRTRLGFHKQNRNRNNKKNRKQTVASLRPSEINVFRNHRKISTTLNKSEATTIASTTTTVTPSTQSQSS
ncbi:uncharacterized protein LOC116344086 isoform X1 [Contarinia nasturtii]|uniref:uncharacterized protein LOC116344086 isoform X1 n=1 Tax=Contarinia nasturtii TaxID=265458 RepID=UPI0012D4BC02|nr:uncharacterized protein LOC116344086 isoform X1 [Contarinia nasturtii]